MDSKVNESQNKGLQDLGYMLFYVFCLECFLSSGFTSRLFSVSPLRWLGNMSYSYYLLHGLVLKFIFMVLGYLYPAQQSETMMLWILLPPIFFLTLIPSSIAENQGNGAIAK